MATPMASSRTRMEPQRQCRIADRETSPGRTKVWREPKLKKVPVVYYLSRNGHLDHPHFTEVTLSGDDGCLRLRDVMDRLDFLRGKGMADSYSWSCKRRYRNGFVWHDISGDDLIHPVHGHECVLMGSELLHPISFPGSGDTNDSSFATGTLPLVPKSSLDGDNKLYQIRRNRAPWRSFDLSEHNSYATDLAADAATQTTAEERRVEIPTITELEAEEISPPPQSSSSPDVAKQLRTVGGCASGRTRATAVLMHLLSCVSVNVKSHHGFTTAVGQNKKREAAKTEEVDGLAVDDGVARIQLEDREYFSGSLIEMKKKEAGDGGGDLHCLKRSSSYHYQGGARQGHGKERSKSISQLSPKGSTMKQTSSQRRWEGQNKDDVGPTKIQRNVM